MKFKLVTIAILALLLCAMVPMAATAVKPESTTIRAPVYVGTFDQNANQWTLSDKPVGRISIDTTTGTYLITCHQIAQPGNHFLGVVASGDTNSVPITLITVNEHGNIMTKGTFDSTQITDIQDGLAAGESLFVSSTLSG